MIFSPRHTAIAAAASLLALTSVAFAQSPSVSKVEVDTSFLSAEGSNVMSYYPNLADDVKARIMERVAPNDDPNGGTLRVDIREISLDGNMALPDSKQFNKLSGVVSYTGEGEDVTMPVSVSAESGQVAPAEGIIVIEPSESDFYNAMMDVFVGAAVDTIPD